jgi:hypothetical protein
MPRRTTRKANASWKPDMRRPAGDLEVHCLTNDAGHVWMHRFDPLPPAVRRRLTESAFNICPACMDIDAHAVAAKRGERKPTVATYFRVIEEIERKLQEA